MAASRVIFTSFKVSTGTNTLKWWHSNWFLDEKMFVRLSMFTPAVPFILLIPPHFLDLLNQISYCGSINYEKAFFSDSAVDIPWHKMQRECFQNFPLVHRHQWHLPWQSHLVSPTPDNQRHDKLPGAEDVPSWWSLPLSTCTDTLSIAAQRTPYHWRLT